ncbi:hypothetical protein HAX54_025014 [Datura stramonium]|uniref:Splicing factor cactin central domain-containing protein n=1 Tax=Datura stramonium TaxID=4076 RepID=A0ABS8UYS4_DATST|nr:hypothetical protein [Datura stramonium]
MTQLKKSGFSTFFATFIAFFCAFLAMYKLICSSVIFIFSLRLVVASLPSSARTTPGLGEEERRVPFRSEQSSDGIRLREGRVKPIDVLIKQLEPSGDLDVEIHEPCVVFKGLAIKEMEELQEDIKLHINLDRETPLHIQYWEAVLVVCNWKLVEARKREATDKARVRGEELPAELLAEERGLHLSIEIDVKSLLQGKGYGELEALQSQIESQMRFGTAKVVEYWEVVLKRLQIYKARACLREIHAKMLRKHLENPLESRDVEMEETLRTHEEDPDHEQNNALSMSPEPFLNEEAKEKEEEEDDDEEAGSYSPVLMHGDDKEEAVDPEEDRAILERKRLKEPMKPNLQSISSAGDILVLINAINKHDGTPWQILPIWLYILDRLMQEVHLNFSHCYTGKVIALHTCFANKSLHRGILFVYLLTVMCSSSFDCGVV